MKEHSKRCQSQETKRDCVETSYACIIPQKKTTNKAAGSGGVMLLSNIYRTASIETSFFLFGARNENVYRVRLASRGL